MTLALPPPAPAGPRPREEGWQKGLPPHCDQRAGDQAARFCPVSWLSHPEAEPSSKQKGRRVWP